MFNVSTNIKTDISMQELHNKLSGSHLNVHDIDFEIFEVVNSETLKVIPHTEHVPNDKTTTLPITNIYKIDDKLVIHSHMRSIDKGLPMFVIILSLGLIVIGIIYKIFGGPGGFTTSLILFSIGVVLQLFMYFRLNVGYFDYVRKIHKWIKNHVH